MNLGEFYKGKKVLVTGADGFMGSHLTEELLKLGAEVSAYVRGNSVTGTVKNELRNIIHIKDKLRQLDYSNKVSDLKILRETINEKNVTIGYANTTFEACDLNTSLCWNESKLVPVTDLKNITELVPVTKAQIKNFIQNAPIGTTYNIILQGYVKSGTTVDVIPEMFNYNYTEYAYWEGQE